MAVGGSGERFGIPVETGGRLHKDRVLFRFGKRVEAVVVTNSSAAGHLIDVQVARDPQFYYPSGVSVDRVSIQSETYFYLRVPAGETRSSPPFFARRGIRLKSVGSGAVWGGAIVHGIDEGDASQRDIE